MAFDGVTVSAIVSELKKNLTGGRIYRYVRLSDSSLIR